MSLARPGALAAALAAVALAVLVSPPGPLPEGARDATRWLAALATAFSLFAVLSAGARWNQPRHAARWLAGAAALFGAGSALYVMAARAQELLRWDRVIGHEHPLVAERLGAARHLGDGLDGAELRTALHVVGREPRMNFMRLSSSRVPAHAG